MKGPDFQSRIGRTLAKRYRLLRLLGTGGMGAVYEAEHEVTRHRVAIKVLHPALGWSSDSVERLLREARLANAIGHPGVIEAFDAGVEEDGTAYIAFKLLEGESVAALVKREARLPVERAVKIASDVLDVLTAAHRRGVVHRDVKPSNVFLATDADGGEPSVKLLDFGVARVIDDEGNDLRQRTLTGTGEVIGTGNYMSPEQVRGDEDVDGRSDLWSVGVMLHELVAGACPFREGNLNMLFVAILSERPTPLADAAPWAPPTLCAVVARALEKDRAKRFQSAAEMKEALVASLDEPTVSHAEASQDALGEAPTEPALAPEAPPARSSESLLEARLVAPPFAWHTFAAAGCVLVALVAFVGFALHRAPHRETHATTSRAATPPRTISQRAAPSPAPGALPPDVVPASEPASVASPPPASPPIVSVSPRSSPRVPATQTTRSAASASPSTARTPALSTPVVVAQPPGGRGIGPAPVRSIREL